MHAFRTRMAACAIALALAATAFAGEARPTSIQVRVSQFSSTVKVKGRLLPGEFGDPPETVEIQCGLFGGTIDRTSLGFSKSKYTYSSATGVIRKFTLSSKSGVFTLEARGTAIGQFPDGFVPVTIDVGGFRSTGLFPVGGTKPSRSWKSGRPYRVTLNVRVLRVRQELGSAVIAPSAGTTFTQPAVFVRNDAAEQARVVGGIARTDADGVFAVTIELRDPSVLAGLDLERLLGQPAGLTVPGTVEAVASRDGEVDVVTFVQPTSGAGGTIQTSAATTFDVAGSAGGTVTFPGGAVETPIASVTFTPYATNAELPGPLPEGFVALAGAELKAPPLVGAKASAEPGAVLSDAVASTVELARPPWTDAKHLATADIRLLQWDGTAWIERPGRGRYDKSKDRFVPDPADKARLRSIRPCVYAAKVAGGGSRKIRGRVRGKKSGQAIERAAVLGRNGGVVSGSRGAFGVPKATLSGESLELVQVLGDDIVSARVIQSAEADSEEVVVFVDEDAGFERVLGSVAGVVFENSGNLASAGASLRLTLSGTVTALSHDDQGTPSFADDTFEIPGLANVGTSTVEWAVLPPGATEEFVSVLRTTASVRPFDLLVEAQNAGAQTVDGAYTVRASFSIPDSGGYALYAGFRAQFDQLVPIVSDIQLPAILEGFQDIPAVANSKGEFNISALAPAGIPMRLEARSADLARVGTREFLFAASVTAGVVLDRDAPHPDLPPGWSRRADMPGPRYEYAVAAARGLLHVIGGYSAEPGGVVPGGAQSLVHEYNPHRDQWTQKTSLPTALQGPGAATVGTKIYVFGGVPAFSGGNATNAALVFDPVANAWSSVAAMPTARWRPSVAAVDGRIYVCGGSTVTNFSFAPVDRVDEYDPTTNTWSQRASLPFVKMSATSVPVIDGRIFLIGGTSSGGTPTGRVDVYDPIANSWSSLQIPGETGSFAAAALGRRIYAVGAGGVPSSAVVLRLDVDDASWTSAAPMSVPRGDTEAVSLGGAIYVPAGRQVPDDYAQRVVSPALEVFVPE